MTHYRHNSAAPLFAFFAGMAAWALFGNKIKDSLAENDDFENLRRQVERKYYRASNATKDTYDQIVEEVTDRYARAKGISQNELQDLVEDLKVHWNRIKHAWREGGENV